MSPFRGGHSFFREWPCPTLWVPGGSVQGTLPRHYPRPLSCTWHCWPWVSSSLFSCLKIHHSPFNYPSQSLRRLSPLLCQPLLPLWKPSSQACFFFRAFQFQQCQSTWWLTLRSVFSPHIFPQMSEPFTQLSEGHFHSLPSAPPTPEYLKRSSLSSLQSQLLSFHLPTPSLRLIRVRCFHCLSFLWVLLSFFGKPLLFPWFPVLQPLLVQHHLVG